MQNTKNKIEEAPDHPSLRKCLHFPTAKKAEEARIAKTVKRAEEETLKTAEAWRISSSSIQTSNPHSFKSSHKAQ